MLLRVCSTNRVFNQEQKQGLKSIRIAGIPDGHAFGRKEGDFPCGTMKKHVILIHRYINLSILLSLAKSVD